MQTAKSDNWIWNLQQQQMKKKSFFFEVFLLFNSHRLDLLGSVLAMLFLGRETKKHFHQITNKYVAGVYI